MFSAAIVDATDAEGSGGDVRMGSSSCRTAEGPYIFFFENLKMLRQLRATKMAAVSSKTELSEIHPLVRAGSAKSVNCFNLHLFAAQRGYRRWATTSEAKWIPFLCFFARSQISVFLAWTWDFCHAEPSTELKCFKPGGHAYSVINS